MDTKFTPFTDPGSVSAYVLDTPRKVPALAALHDMTTQLVSERASASSTILVIGAGGGLEIQAMAIARPNWQFIGVDPSPNMLEVARNTTSPYAARTDLILGTAVDAPPGPFDGAVCLLTLHFLNREERLQTLVEIRRRLKPGSVFVAAHHTAPNGEAEKWLARSAAYSGVAGRNADTIAASAKTMAQLLPLLTPGEEEAGFLAAGFRAPEMFFAAFSFRGWVMTAPY
ncbi:class I SAM-dependent methyltransferase [Rhizobium alvei]|uniref:Class I SAM-dependent methyltransferase n=1 Tax=Rhizobium alvei TaxID=1132659 RepID=A0ABT8YU00_9HYPH|nr:class I SAM-dependent methyltransferase [Rhizobium alvei]MDO6966818.1 class I SAM-dependent methyltransferase [Rhizobium alvei]